MKVKNSNFVDYVKIFCRSGKGGAGSAHFLRDRNTAKGGPDGGDGGRGGHIIIIGNDQMWTLLHLKYQKHLFAEGHATYLIFRLHLDKSQLIHPLLLIPVLELHQIFHLLFEES